MVPCAALSGSSSAHSAPWLVIDRANALNTRRAGRDAELPDREHELRRKSDLVRERISAAATLTHTTLRAQHAAAEHAHAAAALGATMSKLAAFEADSMHVELAEAAHAFGGGCQRVAADASEGLAAAAVVAQVRRPSSCQVHRAKHQGCCVFVDGDAGDRPGNL